MITAVTTDDWIQREREREISNEMITAVTTDDWIQRERERDL